MPGGPAHKHLEPGDVLVRVNGEVGVIFICVFLVFTLCVRYIVLTSFFHYGKLCHHFMRALYIEYVEAVLWEGKNMLEN